MKKTFLFTGLALAAVVIAGAAATWFFVLRGETPAEASLEAARAAIATAAPSSASTSTPGSTTTSPATATVAESTVTGAAGGSTITGTWTPDTTVAGATFVGYRVVEELARVGTATAVGRTAGVTGSVTIDGTTLTAATITADMTKLTSDSNQRDGQLRNQAIQYGTFPTAVFTLSRPVDLSAELASGGEIATNISGTLLLHGVTRDVTVPIKAQLTDGSLLVVGSIEIQFADYNISKPNGASVLSIEDHGIMELQLVLKK